MSRDLQEERGRHEQEAEAEERSHARKRTRFQTCERHRWLEREGRRRRAEFFTEGGPAGSQGCEGGRCRLWPGTDLFEPSVCGEEMTLDWTTP